MRTRTTTMTLLGGALGAAAFGWPAWAALTWARYGRRRVPAGRDPLLDRFLPACEVAERHATIVRAPAPLTRAVLRNTALDASPTVRALIHARERLLGTHGAPLPAGGIVAQLRAGGWGVLAESAAGETVLGTVTRPWEGDVRFQAVAPDAFATFDAPGYVKIVVALGVVPLEPGRALAYVETRVATTDAAARARFRRYWAVFSPGILLIRRAMLRAVKRDAERRHGTALRTGTGVRGVAAARFAARAAGRSATRAVAVARSRSRP